MNHQSDWNEEEDNFDLTLSQRTEELYRVPNMEPNAEGLIEAVFLEPRHEYTRALLAAAPGKDWQFGALAAG